MADGNKIVPLWQGGSLRSYGWVIVFVWDLNEELPYSVFPIRHFENSSDFPMELITGPLSNKSRCDKYKLRNVPGHAHSIFCKIEQGELLICAYLLIHTLKYNY